MARVVFLSGAPVPSAAAGAVASMRFAAALAVDHEVTLLVARAESEVTDPFDYYGVPHSFTLRSLPRRAAVGYVARAAVDVLARARPEIVLARDHLLALTVPSAAPLVVEVHDLPTGKRALLERALLRRPSLARLVFITARLRDAYLREFRVPSRVDVMIAGSAHDLPPFEPRAEDDGSTLTLGFVGHAYAGKGADRTLTVAERLPDVRLRLALADSPRARGIAHRAAGLPNVDLVGPLFPRDVDTFWQSVDVALAPYAPHVVSRAGRPIHEWMSPLKVVEALASGRALIVSELPALRELIDETCALLVPPGDDSALVAAVESLRDASLRTRLGAAARERVATTLSWSRRAERVLAGLA